LLAPLTQTEEDEQAARDMIYKQKKNIKMVNNQDLRKIILFNMNRLFPPKYKDKKLITRKCQCNLTISDQHIWLCQNFHAHNTDLCIKLKTPFDPNLIPKIDLEKED
jgi:hypothetical protein